MTQRNGLGLEEKAERGHGEELGDPGSPARARVPINCSRWEEADLWVGCYRINLKSRELEWRQGG